MEGGALRLVQLGHVAAPADLQQNEEWRLVDPEYPAGRSQKGSDPLLVRLHLLRDGKWDSFGVHINSNQRAKNAGPREGGLCCLQKVGRCLGKLVTAEGLPDPIMVISL